VHHAYRYVEFACFSCDRALEASPKKDGKKEDEMKRIGVVFACLTLLPLLSFAQVTAAGIVANVDFGFYAGGKLLPAGSYEFKPAGSTESTLNVLNTKTRETSVVPILTTISNKLPADGEVVFDHAGNDYYLTEIFIPGTDGFLLKGAQGKHTHVSVKAKK
jgi:hypothetical protein